MAYKWMALLGEFEMDQDSIQFLGKEIAYQDRPGPAVGNLICDQKFGGGRITAGVQFQTVNDFSACEVILFYDLGTQTFITAGLGGLPFAMFTLREFRTGVSNPQWINHAVAGHHANLKADVWYELTVELVGSVVHLDVDGVRVLTADLPYSPPESQVGIWCRGDHSISVRDFRVAAVRPEAFIVMQFGSPYDAIYGAVIKRVCEDVDLRPLRADEIYGPGFIIRDITQAILRSRVVIADITPTPPNANVYFEVGYAFAQNKPVILLAERSTALPFDVSAFRVLFYEDTIAGKGQFERALRKHLSAILGLAATVDDLEAT